MKIIVLVLFLFIAPANNIMAQAQDRALEQMMTKRILTKEDVAYNIASLVPGLYKEHKFDTIKQLIDYYERNYRPDYTVTPLKFLMDIKYRQFAEKITLPRFYLGLTYSDTALYDQSVLPILKSFYRVCYKMVAPGAYQEDIQSQYIPYLSFIGSLAQELKATPGLAPAEKFLVNYFAHPTDTGLNELRKAEYNGTRLQRLWLKEGRRKEQERESISGGGIGIVAGSWVPLGNLSLVGPHPYLGILMGGRGEHFSVDLNMNLRFLRSANYYTVKAEQTLYNTRYYSGGYIGLDGTYELWRKRKNCIEILGGVAVDFLDALKYDSKDKNSVSKELASANFNVGLGYRLLVRQFDRTAMSWGRSQLMHTTTYLAIQAKYNVINYKNDGGTPLNGHGLTFGVIFGCYSHKIK